MKTKMKEFINIKQCEKYINEFSKKKKILNKEIIAINHKPIRYIVVMDYKD